jgi:FKBP-type peptidyl-prolyl cis-trans isomerase
MEGFTELPGSNGNVFKKITRDGSGNGPSSGADVTVDYKGYFKDGKVFDQSYGRKRFNFKVGVGQVIKGWDLGVLSMKKGEKATFYIKSDYAYGKRGAGGVIPPNTDLLFDVELHSF